MAESEPESRFVLRRGPEDASTFAGDVRKGLTAVRKSISPRYFYDDLGSALFEAITHLPEYYVTRAETEILNSCRNQMAARMGSVARVIELGSGSARKTRILLEELTSGGNEVQYVPVDVDVSMLQKTSRELLAQYPGLSVLAVSADFRRAARVVRDAIPRDGRNALLFLGSTIGNLDRDDAVALLRDLRSILRNGESLILGADLKKAKSILDAAYNDTLGVTAAFNMNLLSRMNRELGAHFDLQCFGHRAFYDESQARIEMHLVSLREQNVRIDALGIDVAFNEGETIHTENSYKYDDEMIESLATGSGFDVTTRWTDSRGWFADFLLTAV